MNYTEYKEDIGYFYEVTPMIDMQHFVEITLASLANKSQDFYFYKTNKKTAYLPINYKNIIENIMYEANGWGIRFSPLINIKTYYENQLDWEIKLANQINKYLNTHDKQISIDLENDYYKIEFQDEEINQIMAEYDDDFLNIVDHFTNLLKDQLNNDRAYQLREKEFNRKIERLNTKAQKSLILNIRNKGIKNPNKYLKNK